MKSFGLTLFASALALVAGCSSGAPDAPSADDTGSNTESLRGGRHGHEEPPTDPCALVRCAAGTQCVVTDGNAACVEEPETDGCALILCAPGTTCELIDGEGTCTPIEPSGPFCGGFGGFECPGSGSCVDDATDDCDPNDGGADCSGVCECNVRALCIQGFVFDESPEVCACVPDEPEVDACATVRCREGFECVVVDGDAVCQETVNPCAATTCLEGTECVVVDGEAVCQEPFNPCAAATCPVGSECVVEDGEAVCQEPFNPCAAILCPVGSECVVEDGEGSCVPSAPFCGGFAGIECPGAGECADVPGDGCDPADGGADCGGACECNVRALCVQGFVFDAAPQVCACIPLEENPCNLVDCIPNTICEVQNGEAVCLPVPTNPCAAVLCGPGTVCVADGDQASCEPIESSCD